jgi:hypothetical protein
MRLKCGESSRTMLPGRAAAQNSIPSTFCSRKRDLKESSPCGPCRPKYIEVKLPPETDEITSMRSMRRVPSARVIFSISRSTPYANPAAREPPPEKVSTTKRPSSRGRDMVA